MSKVVRIKRMQLTIVNIRASFELILPEGISRMAVLGFCASISLSKYLLKAIAEFLAKIMHNTISKSLSQLNSCPVIEMARKKPINANGIAKTVWANNTREKYFFIYNSVFN
jgi:hypothetical protein